MIWTRQSFTHWVGEKWPPFCRRHIFIIFFDEKYCISNETLSDFNDPIDSKFPLVQIMSNTIRQSLTWTDAEHAPWCHMTSLDHIKNISSKYVAFISPIRKPTSYFTLQFYSFYLELYIWCKGLEWTNLTFMAIRCILITSCVVKRRTDFHELHLIL